MVDKDYIFNIPKNHVSALLAKVYTTEKQLYTLVIQEIGEFLQAYSKCSTNEWRLEVPRAHREHLIEEMTHVLVCLGMIAMSEGVLQSEIDAQIQKKAIDGVEYPFDVHKHAPIDRVLAALGCYEEEDRLSHHTGEDTEITLISKSLLGDVLFYLREAYDPKNAAVLNTK